MQSLRDLAPLFRAHTVEAIVRRLVRWPLESAQKRDRLATVMSRVGAASLGQGNVGLGREQQRGHQAWAAGEVRRARPSSVRSREALLDGPCRLGTRESHLRQPLDVAFGRCVEVELSRSGCPEELDPVAQPERHNAAREHCGAVERREGLPCTSLTFCKVGAVGVELRLLPQSRGGSDRRRDVEPH